MRALRPLLQLLLLGSRAAVRAEEEQYPRRGVPVGEAAKLRNEKIGLGPQCDDVNPPECSGWAERGECRANAEYMQRYCRRSCNRCDASPSIVAMEQSSFGKIFVVCCAHSQQVKEYLDNSPWTKKDKSKPPRCKMDYKNPWKPEKMIRHSGLLAKLNGKDKDQYRNKHANEKLHQIKFWKTMKDIKHVANPGSGPVSLHATAYRGNMILDPKDAGRPNTKFVPTLIQNISDNDKNMRVEKTPLSTTRGNYIAAHKPDAVDWSTIMRNPMEFTPSQINRLTVATVKKTAKIF